MDQARPEAAQGSCKIAAMESQSMVFGGLDGLRNLKIAEGCSLEFFRCANFENPGKLGMPC